MKTQTQQPKTQETVQPKAEKQASVETILGSYNSPLQPKVIDEEPLQGKFNGVIQRDAFWPVDENNKVTDNTPTANAPGGRYIKRLGASINHRLYNRSTEAKNAARRTTDWGDNGLSTRNPNTPNAGAGYYQYNQNVTKVGDSYEVNAGTAMIVRHDQDPDAQLYSSQNPNVAETEVAHWHAATSNKADIKAPDSTAQQPLYNTIDIEHFYINPFL